MQFCCLHPDDIAKTTEWLSPKEAVLFSSKPLCSSTFCKASFLMQMHTLGPAPYMLYWASKGTSTVWILFNSFCCYGDFCFLFILDMLIKERDTTTKNILKHLLFSHHDEFFMGLFFGKKKKKSWLNRPKKRKLLCILLVSWILRIEYSCGKDKLLDLHPAAVHWFPF